MWDFGVFGDEWAPDQRMPPHTPFAGFQKGIGVDHTAVVAMPFRVDGYADLNVSAIVSLHVSRSRSFAVAVSVRG